MGAALTRKEIATAALTTAVAAVPLAYAFAHTEIGRWWQEYPVFLVVLCVIGIVLSFIGAALPLRFSLPTIELRSRLAQIAAGSILGVLFGFIAGAAAWMASDITLWALLIWFFFGALVSATYFAVVPKRAVT